MNPVYTVKLHLTVGDEILTCSVHARLGGRRAGGGPAAHGALLRSGEE